MASGSNLACASPIRASIVVINHDYGEFLRVSLDSALTQSFAGVEVIVVDDGSQDDSRAIIASYGDRLRAVYQDNGGHTSAVNAGFAASTGDYVLFLDADDWLDPDCLAVAIAALRPEDAKVQFQLATINRQGQDQNMPFPYFPPDFSPELVDRQARASGWYPWTVSTGNVYARWYLAQVFPLDVGRVYRSPDGYLNKLAPLFGPVRSLPRVLGAYRVHGRNAWASSANSWTQHVVVNWLRFNQVLEAAFVDCARKRGIALRRPLIHPFQKLEYEILAHRFAPRDPVVAQGLLATLGQGLRWLVLLHPDGWSGSIARLVWLMLLAFAPRRLAEREVRRARAQTDRSPLWRHLLQLTRQKE